MKTEEKALDKLEKEDFEKIQACSNLFQALLDNIVENYNINNLAPKTREEQTNLEKLQQDYKNLEIKYLNAQLNPHFLFNALNAVGRQAYLENATKTQEIIYSIADIMRHSLTEAGLLITLEKELKNINNYIFIQTQRFGENISFATNIDSNTLSNKVPAMLVLNLIENAVGHGIEPKQGRGHVTLNVSKKDKKLYITVKDNGVGIKPATLNALHQENYSTNISKRHIGLGLYNTKKRLEHFFLEDYKFNIVSEENIGTLITIVIPIL